MQFFEEITRLAVVGIDRSPVSESAKKKLVELGFEPSGDAARDLLTGLAVASRLRKSGYFLDKISGKKTSPLVAVAPAETRFEANAEAARAMHLMLRGAHPECVEEWLLAACHFQKTTPKALIPQLLGLFYEKKYDFEKLGAALGERGKWLAAQHSDWEKLVENAIIDESDFENSSHLERLLFFKNLRKNEPERAILFLQKCWAEEPPEHRLAFLKCLENALSQTDEPFLEICLADRRKEIRRTSIQFLAKIDGSRLALKIEKMLERLLVFDKKTGHLEVDWAFDFEKNAPAALIENFGSAKMASAKSTLLGEFLDILPLIMFEKRFEKGPTEGIASLLQSQSAGLLMPLLIAKTDVEKAENWSLELVRAWADRPDLAVWACEPFVHLLQNLPSKTFSEEVGRAFSERHFLFEAAAPLTKMLASGRSPFWSRGMTLAAFQHIHFWLERSTELSWNGWFLEATLQKIALRAAPECADSVRQLFFQTDGKRTSPISPRIWNQVFGTMDFRGRFRRALVTD